MKLFGILLIFLVNGEKVNSQKMIENNTKVVVLKVSDSSKPHNDVNAHESSEISTESYGDHSFTESVDNSLLEDSTSLSSNISFNDLEHTESTKFFTSESTLTGTTSEFLTTFTEYSTSSDISSDTTPSSSTVVEITTTNPDDESIETSNTSAGCRIESCNHTLTEDNILTINWNTSGNCSSSLINIYLKNLSCVRRCEEFKISNDCHGICRNQFLNIRNNGSYTLENSLEPCANYNYTLQVHSSFFDETSLKTNFKNSTLTNLNKTEEIINETVLNMNVTWNYEYPECGIKVELLADNVSPIFHMTKNNFFVFENVTACTDYDIKVSLSDSNGNEGIISDSSINCSITTTHVEPSPIRDLSLSYAASEDAINIRWVHPMYGHKCFGGYKIISWTEFEEKKNVKYVEATDTSTFARVDYQCVTYYVSVMAVTNSSDSEVTTTTLLPDYTLDTTTIKVAPQESDKDAKVHQNETQSVDITAKLFKSGEIVGPSLIDRTDTSFSFSVSVKNDYNKCDVKGYTFICFNEENLYNATNINETEYEAKAIVENLEPYNNYTCFVAVKNEAGWAEGTNATFSTKQGIPNAPYVSINHASITSTSFSFTWQEPTEPKGEITNYSVWIERIEFLYDLPENCSVRDSKFMRRVDYNETRFTYEMAQPFANYSIKIQAINEDEEGDFSLNYVDTIQAKSNVVENFQILQNIIDPNMDYNSSVVLKWQFPCNANGNITNFMVKKNNYENYSINYKFGQRNFSHLLSLDPNEEYEISVIAQAGLIDGEIIQKRFKLAPGIPSSEEISNMSDFVTLQSTAKHYADFAISLSVFELSVGRVEKIALLINEVDCFEMVRERGLSRDDDLHDKLKWHDAVTKDCIPQYHADNIHHPTASAFIARKLKSQKLKDENPLVFDIGRSNCDGVISTCNGALKSGTKYALTFRFYTENGYADSGYITFTTDKDIPILAIIISFVIIMCIVFGIGFYITYKKPNNSSIANQYDRKDVPVQNFEMYYNQMIANENEKIKEEFKAIQFFSEGLDKTIIASKANERCNRYANISPFDNNRVVLNDDEFENDYINASFINGYYYAKEYIAAQGPKPNTAHDFWRMVLQYKIESIVMLTSLTENNKIKCHEYFPKLNGRVCFDNIKIVCTGEQKLSNYVKRILEVEKLGTKFQVKHYYFSKWLDHSACNAIDLIDFVKTIRMERERPSDTFIVHCSAGVGRTGTFIAVDILIQQMKQENKFNIFDLVKQLRKQRMKMVQTQDQYTTLYHVAKELSASRTKRPAIIQNIALYFENIELFKNLKRRGNRTDDNDNNVKSNDKESSL